MNLLQIHEPGQTPLPHEDIVAVGIDLGTTNSVVAVSTDQQAEVILDADGRALIPSVVQYKPDGIEVGQKAKDHILQGEKNIVSSVKRLMGRGIKDVQSILHELPYEVIERDGVIRLRLAGRELTPVEVSADILRHIKRQAETALGKDIRQAVITVPAYFDDAARTATKDAAKLAGLEVLRLVNEPTAAALAYGLDNAAEGIYAIYDLGGGTFDISLLKLEKGVFQVLSTAGDTELGGDDFDRLIARHLIAAGESDGKAMSVLLARARELKEGLSNADTAQACVYKLTREEFEAMVEPLVGRTLTICRQALDDAKVVPADVNGVVLVGGSTRVPLVRKKVETFFGKAPLTNVNPDEVVAVGAALQAEGLTRGSDNLLLDVTPLSLGLETMGGLAEKIIHRNTPIPVSVSQEFTTYQDGQAGMLIHAVQGEREMVSQCRSLARFVLSEIPPMVAGMARIKVTFAVDADGLLTVSAQEMTTGKEQRVEVKPSYGLPPEEIERMLRESMEHAKEDILERLLVEAKVEAERTMQEIASAVAADGELLEDKERKALEKQLMIVKKALEGKDRDAIDYEVQQLHGTVREFAERRMNKAIGSVVKGVHVKEFQE